MRWKRLLLRSLVRDWCDRRCCNHYGWRHDQWGNLPSEALNSGQLTLQNLWAFILVLPWTNVYFLINIIYIHTDHQDRLRLRVALIGQTKLEIKVRYKSQHWKTASYPQSFQECKWIFLCIAVPENMLQVSVYKTAFCTAHHDWFRLLRFQFLCSVTFHYNYGQGKASWLERRNFHLIIANLSPAEEMIQNLGSDYPKVEFFHDHRAVTYRGPEETELLS